MSSELPKNCKTVAVVASETAAEKDSGAVMDSGEEGSVVEGSVVEGSVAVTEAVEQVEQVVQEPPPFVMSLKLTYHHMSI